MEKHAVAGVRMRLTKRRGLALQLLRYRFGGGGELWL